MFMFRLLHRKAQDVSDVCSVRIWNWIQISIGMSLILIPKPDMYVFGATAPSGSGPPHWLGFKITQKDAPQSVGLLWASDQLVAETCTRQHTTFTTDKHSCPRWGFETIISANERPQTYDFRPRGRWDRLRPDIKDPVHSKLNCAV